MSRLAGKIRIRAAAAACAALLVAVRPAAGGTPPSNVPDAVTRATGLRVQPMPRAAQIYAANCQGCHGLGRSVSEIPALADRVGYFTRIPEGREYLVEVPNVALNPSSDADLAALLNWVLDTYSRAQLPPDFKAYTAAEVGRLRQERIDVKARRRHVVELLLAARQIPSADALAIPPSPLY